MSPVIFNGVAVMDAQTGPAQETHDYNGTWSGGFFNDSAAGTAEDDPHPDSVAGTFGVTRDTMTGTDEAPMITTESFVGAFGAHKQ